MLTLTEISDRIEITDLLTRYCRAVDSSDWDRLDDVLTSDSNLDYTASGGIAGPFPEVKTWLARMLPLFPHRQHILGQAEVTLADDEARVVAYFTNPMVFGDGDATGPLWEFGGLYHHWLTRTAGGWRSRRLVEEIVWETWRR